ncbi:MAG: hypothetical protein KDB80_05505 [Planctomycetes bacterium]|nr:hypothetical protein [Planctomycetota bacterium]
MPNPAPPHVLLAVLLLVPSCAQPSGGQRAIRPGPVELTSDAQMCGFLAAGRLSKVGPSDERARDWFEFQADGSFTAMADGDALAGRWIATETELRLADLSTGVEDRTLPLRWLDGKINVEIDGVQYRRYGPARR